MDGENVCYALQCENLSLRYSNGTQALTNIHLKLNKGDIHVILGANGAGKTTFLKLATTELFPTCGTIKILDKDTTKYKKDISKIIGVMPQQVQLYKQLTVWEHIYYFTLLKGLNKKKSSEETERVMALLDISNRRHQEINSLSGGLINTVNLAQSLTGNSDILFLDEPTVGLDPLRRRIIWDYVKSLRGKKTVILSTQYLDEANELADNIIIFNKGQIVHEGDLDSTLGKLNYELKIEFSKEYVDLERLSTMDDEYTIENDKIVLFAKDGKRSFEKILQLNIDISTIKIYRPMLEEAFMNLITGEKASELSQNMEVTHDIKYNNHS